MFVWIWGLIRCAFILISGCAILICDRLSSKLGHRSTICDVVLVRIAASHSKMRTIFAEDNPVSMEARVSPGVASALTHLMQSSPNLHRPLTAYMSSVCLRICISLARLVPLGANIRWSRGSINFVSVLIEMGFLRQHATLHHRLAFCCSAALLLARSWLSYCVCLSSWKEYYSRHDQQQLIMTIRRAASAISTSRRSIVGSAYFPRQSRHCRNSCQPAFDLSYVSYRANLVLCAQTC